MLALTIPPGGFLVIGEGEDAIIIRLTGINPSGGACVAIVAPDRASIARLSVEGNAVNPEFATRAEALRPLLCRHFENLRPGGRHALSR